MSMIQRESFSALRELSDTFLKHFRALKNLGEPVDHWDTLLLQLVTSKFDSVTKRDWEAKVITNNYSTTKHLIDFLSVRCRMLEAMHSIKSQQTCPKGPSLIQPNKRIERTFTHVTMNKSTNCPVCKGEHRIYSCKGLLDLSIPARINEIRRLNLCINCLGANHRMCDCTARACKHCNKRHHTLLHLENKYDTTRLVNQASTKISRDELTASTSKPLNENTEANNPSNSTVSVCSIGQMSQVMLSTALIYIVDNAGKKHEARALLDSGSQSNFMTKELQKRLNLENQQSNTKVSGINQISTQVLETTNALVQSRVSKFNTQLSFLILDTITDKVPSRSVDVNSFKIPNNINLADPLYNIPQKIDILLGAGVFWNVLCREQIHSRNTQPLLQQTKFGWILAGTFTPISKDQSRQNSVCGFVSTHELHSQLEKFWHVEECHDTRKLTKEEIACEEHFCSTHKRREDGGFEVVLPLREEPTELGSSKEGARKRLLTLEKKFNKSSRFKQRYLDFMNEYETLEHMSEVADDNTQDPIAIYLPHHGVEKESSTTTKLRVVFDASNKTTSGRSLNDILRVGPTIQRELTDIIIRFRQHRYVFTADISKMYRQISVTPEQRNLQRILWRNDVTQPVRSYQLNTVTYGTGPAPFLAVRCLHQLVIENEELLPDASKIIKRDFYVDDLITGGSDLNRLQTIRVDIINILRSASFKLHKWNSNHSDLLDVDAQTSEEVYTIGEGVKTLGLLWQPRSDQLTYQVNILNEERDVSKRAILSTVAQIFDPLGLVGPAIITAKILFQRLWQQKLDWDDPIPPDLHEFWINYRTQLPTLNEITTPRHVLCEAPSRIELHAFCDASERAYGVCVYLRSTNSHGHHTTELLCAKSRVAPLKKLCLPRLELCGAVLLAKLCHKVTQALTINIDERYYWSDSTIVLAWIRGEASRWKTFVSNRVSEIQGMTNKLQWKHVRSADNPADVISRGIEPEQLIHQQLWWKGPKWLSQNCIYWPTEGTASDIDIPEERSVRTALAVTVDEFDVIQRYSSLTKLKRVVAYCLRFKYNALRRKSDVERRIGPLSIPELESAMTIILTIAQVQEFSQELHDLKKHKGVKTSSKLLTLHPFIDEVGLIRVGGRLNNAPISYGQKHPIVLSSKHILTVLIIREAHYRHLHAGALALLAILRERYWILSARNSIRRVLLKCTVCFRLRPYSPNQLMGYLPATRVTPSRPFAYTGVDYAGPFPIKISRNKTGKAYLCLFVCMATKAVHLEVVSNLTTYAFLNSLKRFVSRRGKCIKIFSDNGKTFIGAKNELKDLGVLLSSQKHQQQTIDFSTEQSIEWNFIPPYSPHMGGLWEAGVKSAKTHLKAVVGKTILYFEELCTIFTLIEACLNSRPLSPLSTDPDDLLALSPGHFLIGAPLLAIPEPNILDLSINRLNRYQLVTKMHQDFWKRWSREYVTQLQSRTKWNKIHANKQLIPGTMILLRDENVPPMAWRLGRITATHPGVDGLIRTVSIRTQNGVVQRTLPKICVLPIEQ